MTEVCWTLVVFDKTLFAMTYLKGLVWDGWLKYGHHKQLVFWKVFFFQSVLWHTSSCNQQLYCLFLSDDETRVVLSEVVKAPGADYINANYIAVSISIIYYNFLPLAALACIIMSNFMHYTWKPIKEQTRRSWSDSFLWVYKYPMQCKNTVQCLMSHFYKFRRLFFFDSI